METKTVYLTNIKYKDNMKYLSVAGPTALQNFITHTSFSCYDSESAPTEYKMIVTADFDDESIFDIIYKQASDELGLEIKSCMVRY